MAKGWHGDPYRHSLAAKGISTKMMKSKLMDRDIYQRINVLKTGVDGNIHISASIEKHPDKWDRKHPLRNDAQTIVALKDSSVGSVFPGLDPDNIIGYIRYVPRYPKDGYRIGYELSYLEVRKDWQNKGVGYAMLGTFFDHVVEYDEGVFIMYGSEEGKRFFDDFMNDPIIKHELWERDVNIVIEE